MIKCEVCGRENGDGFRFCLDCGSELAAGTGGASAGAPPVPGSPSATLVAPPPPLPDAPPPVPAPSDPPTDPSPTPIPLTKKAAPAETPVPLTTRKAGTRPCVRCGHPVPPEHAFCADCGAPVPAPRNGVRSGPAGAEAAFALVAVRPDGTDGPRLAVAHPVTAGTGESELHLADDPWVDDAHARFAPDAGGLTVDDLGSRSGTWLRVPPGEAVRLAPGASLRLGHQRLDLEALAPAAEVDGVRVWGSPDPGYRLRLVQRLDDGAQAAAWPLAEGTYALGREQGDVVFPGDGFVSGRHGRLTVQADGHATFEDLGSSNGTYLRLAERTRLKAGDLVLLGSHLLRVDAA